MLRFDLYRLLNLALTLLFWAIFLRAILSWVHPDPYNPIVRFLDRVTEPLLAPLRRHLPSLGNIDISPLVAMFLIEAAKILLRRLLFGHL